MRDFQVYRWNPDDGAEPAHRHLRDRPRHVRPDGPRRADQDQERGRSDADLPPLLPGRHLRLLRHEHRRSNTLACLKPIEDVKGEVRINPLPHMAVVKDLVPDSVAALRAATQHRALAEVRHAAAAGCRAPAEQRGTRQARRAVGVHPVLLLHHRLPELLVERRPLSRPRGAAAGLSLDRRQPRRSDRRAAGRAGGPVQALSLPHHHELHADLPEGPQPGKAIGKIKQMMVGAGRLAKTRALVLKIMFGRRRLDIARRARCRRGSTACSSTTRVFRAVWDNWATVVPGPALSLQPSHARAARGADAALRASRTLINLRGHRQCGSDALSRDAAARLGLTHIDAPSRAAARRTRTASCASRDLQHDGRARADPLQVRCRPRRPRRPACSAARRRHARDALRQLPGASAISTARAPASWTPSSCATRATGEGNKPFLDWVREDYDEHATAGELPCGGLRVSSTTACWRGSSDKLGFIARLRHCQPDQRGAERAGEREPHERRALAQRVGNPAGEQSC